MGSFLGRNFLIWEKKYCSFKRGCARTTPQDCKLKEILSQDLLKMSILAPYKSGFPLGDVVSRSGESLTFQWAPSQLDCNACIEVSKQVEKVLLDPQILDKIEELSTSICTPLPSNFCKQCVQMGRHI